MRKEVERASKAVKNKGSIIETANPEYFNLLILLTSIAGIGVAPKAAAIIITQ